MLARRLLNKPQNTVETSVIIDVTDSMTERTYRNPLLVNAAPNITIGEQIFKESLKNVTFSTLSEIITKMLQPILTNVFYTHVEPQYTLQFPLWTENVQVYWPMK